MATYMDRLPTEEQEIESLQRYVGFMHTKINILGDFDLDKMSKLQKKGWDLEISEEELVELIDDFTNLYGYILKNGRDDGRKLIRGTTTDEADKLVHRNNVEISSAWSTTTDIDVAKTFCQYSKAALIRIRTGNVPCVEIEDVKSENSRREDEVLLLPFTKVKSGELTSQYEGFNYYDIALEKEELPDINDKELDLLRKEVIPEFPNFVVQIKELKKVSDRYEWLTSMISRANKEDIADIRKDIDKTEKIFSSLRKDVNNYKSKFSVMLKGLCRQREKDIDEKRKVDIQKAAIEYKKRKTERENQLKTNIEDQMEINKNNAVIIDGQISGQITDFAKTIEFYRRMSQTLGIKTFNSSPELSSQTLQTGNKIVEGLYEEISLDNLEDEYNLLEKIAQNHINISQEICEIPNFIDSYNSSSFKEVKAALNEKVQEMIAHSTIQSLQKQKNNLLAQKDTIVQKIFGEYKLKQAKLKNIDAKIQLTNKIKTRENPQNSVRIALYNMYRCAYEYYGGVLPPEMENMEKAIRSSFTNIPTSEEIKNKVLQNMKTGLPNLYSQPKGIFKFLKNREQAKGIERDTLDIQSRTSQIEEAPLRKNNKQTNEVARLYTEIQATFGKVKEYLPTNTKENIIDTKENYFKNNEGR